MISRMQMMDTLLGKQIVDALIETLYVQTEDFPEIHQAYLNAVKELNTTLGPDAKRSIQKYVAAIEQQCASNLYFAGVLGLQMNLEHFRNPMTPNCTWAQVDYDDYLRTNQAYALPLYQSAQKYVSQFEKNLPADLQTVTESVTCYRVALEVSGMKLAHFHGYLAGNDLLKCCIPGYRPDHVLDFQYRCMLEQYFGGPLRMEQWDGCIPAQSWRYAPVQETDPQTIHTLREEIWKNVFV